MRDAPSLPGRPQPAGTPPACRDAFRGIGCKTVGRRARGPAGGFPDRQEGDGIEHLVAEEVEEVPMLAEHPVERRDLPGAEVGDPARVHVGEHLVVPFHRQAPAQVRIIELRHQCADPVRHPLRRPRRPDS